MGLFDLALRIVALCVLLACAETLAHRVHGAVCYSLEQVAAAQAVGQNCARP